MEKKAKKVIMISGENRGIGRAIAEKLLENGYLLSLGVRNPGQLPQTLASAAETQILCHSYDARDRESAKSWVEATAEKATAPKIGFAALCPAHSIHLSYIFFNIVM